MPVVKAVASCLLGISLGVLAESFARAQENRLEPQSNLREQLLEAVLPIARPSNHQATGTIRIRLQPSFDTESLLELTFNDSAAEIVFGQFDVPVAEYLSGASPSSSVEALSKAAPITRSRKSIDSALASRTLANFWKAFANSSNSMMDRVGTLQLDGTRYELRVELGSTSMSFDLLDEEARADAVTGEIPLVRWINATRLELLGSKKPINKQ